MFRDVVRAWFFCTKFGCLGGFRKVGYSLQYKILLVKDSHR